MDELKTKGEEIQKFSNDVVNTKIEELIALTSNLDWEGPAYKKFINLFDDNIKQIKYVVKIIEAYGKFMVNASDGYIEANKEIAFEMQNIIDKINYHHKK